MKMVVLRSTGSVGSNPGQIMSASFYPENDGDKQRLIEALRRWGNEAYGHGRRVEAHEKDFVAVPTGQTDKWGNKYVTHSRMEVEDAIAHPDKWECLDAYGLNMVSHDFGVPTHAGMSDLYQFLTE